VPEKLAFAGSVQLHLPLVGPLKVVLGSQVAGHELVLVAFQRPTREESFLRR